jgi:predicted nucleic acid-binding protein
MAVVVDTTVWIDFFKGAVTPGTQALDGVVRRGDAVLGDIVLGEILQGVSDDRQFRILLRHLSAFAVQPMVGRRIAVQSAVNYRKLRARGLTVRKTVDCWIATFCIERGFALLHDDRDFDPFEKYLGLKTFR